MTILITILHFTVCLALIAIVLLQSGKGAEMGASFGASGSQSVFGAGGGSTFMSKLTTGAAVIFMLTSLTLAYLSGQGGSSSVMSSKSSGKPAAPTGQTQQMPLQGKPPATQPVAPQSAPQSPVPPVK